MADRMSESTEALLEAFEADFQRQLRHSAVVERLVVREEEDGGLVTLVATVRAATDEIELTGTGDNLLTAYASLTHAALPELILAIAYRQVLEQALGA
jgi:hypothetical protein